MIYSPEFKLYYTSIIFNIAEKSPQRLFIGRPYSLFILWHKGPIYGSILQIRFLLDQKSGQEDVLSVYQLLVHIRTNSFSIPIHIFRQTLYITSNHLHSCRLLQCELRYQIALFADGAHFPLASTPLSVDRDALACPIFPCLATNCIGKAIRVFEVTMLC